MSWLCKQCETVNQDDSLIKCEVCDEVSPHLSKFDYDEINPLALTEVRWKAEECDCVKAVYDGRETELTGRESAEIALKPNTEILFKLLGKGTEREYTYFLSQPIISVTLTPDKLKRGRKGESATLKWDISGASEIRLLVNGENEVQLAPKGSMMVSPAETTVFHLCVTRLDGTKTLERDIVLNVLPEAQIAFSADKQFSFPKIPILLTWQVEYAKSVELVGYGKVEANGSKVVEIEKDTSFELRVTDDFGIQTRKVDVRMLPLPVIKTIMVPTPQICKKVVVKNNIPSMQATIPMMQNLTAPIDASRLALPTFEGLNIEMKGIAAHILSPKFHLLQLDIGKRHWWSKLELKIKELNHFLKLK